MAEFVKGQVVIIPFPFSDLSGSKRRPAFVVANIPGPDIILCQITSKVRSDPYAIMIENSDFIRGSLPFVSYIRPNKLFTADKSIILSAAGHVSDTKTSAVISMLTDLIQGKITPSQTSFRPL